MSPQRLSSRQTTTVRNLAKIQLTAATGAITFEKRTVWFYPSTRVWVEMQRLHQASLANPRAAAAAHKYPPDRAKKAFQKVLACVLGQFSVVSDLARQTMFIHLLDVIARSRSFDGLESPFLTGLNTMGALGHADIFGRGVTLWKELGPPSVVGGGGRSAPVLDTSTDLIVFLNAQALGSLGPNGVHASILSPAKVGNLVSQVREVGISEIGVAQDGDSCVKHFKFGGTIVGGWFGAAGGVLATGASGPGAVAGGIAGGLAGGAAGGSIGGAVGDEVCGWIDSAGSSGDKATGVGDEVEDVAGQAGQSGGSTPESQGTSSQDTTGQGTENTDDSGSGEPDSGDDDTGDESGFPDPNDPNGFPDPNDPRGVPAVSGTYATGPGLRSFVSQAGNGWMLHGVPQLSADGQNLTKAGFLGAVPGIAAKAVGIHSIQVPGAAVLQGEVASSAAAAAATTKTVSTQK